MPVELLSPPEELDRQLDQLCAVASELEPVASTCTITPPSPEALSKDSGKSGLARKLMLHSVTGILASGGCAAVGVISVQLALAYMFGACVTAGLCVLELRRDDSSAS